MASTPCWQPLMPTLNGWGQPGAWSLRYLHPEWLPLWSCFAFCVLQGPGAHSSPQGVVFPLPLESYRRSRTCWVHVLDVLETRQLPQHLDEYKLSHIWNGDGVVELASALWEGCGGVCGGCIWGFYMLSEHFFILFTLRLRTWNVVQRKRQLWCTCKFPGLDQSAVFLAGASLHQKGFSTGSL